MRIVAPVWLHSPARDSDTALRCENCGQWKNNGRRTAASIGSVSEFTRGASHAH